MSTVVAFQGTKGAYSEIAAKAYFENKPDLETKPCDSFDEVFDLVESGAAQFGFCPIENSLSGNFLQVYDLLINRKVYIIGEHASHDANCLVVHSGTKLEDVKVVFSHPHVLDQCDRYLRKLNVTKMATTDTAGACQLIKGQGQSANAAIASRLAAEVAGLTILQEGIEDDPNSSTRYIVISKTLVTPPSHIKAKTSFAVSLKNQPGALFRALASFALRDINISKIESRPSSRAGPMHSSARHWEYMYAIDVEANSSSELMKNAIANLNEFANSVQILGSYPVFQPKVGGSSYTTPFGL